MAIQLGPLFAEVIDPESEKFTAPLLLVSGLWERASAWRRFAGYLAHRGWRCIAVERRAGADLAACVHDLRAALATLDAPPVVVGHDLGAVLALLCAEHARAVIALAPLLGPPFAPPAGALERAGSWLARLRGTPLRAPGGRWRRAYPRTGAVEPAPLVRQLLAGMPSITPPTRAVPRLVLAIAGDEVTSMAAAQAFALQFGAEFEVVSGDGHAALASRGWETLVAAVHRWIIQRLGTDLLALYDESISGEE